MASPVIIAGSIQLLPLSQFRLVLLAEVVAAWFTEEQEAAFGSPPKLMLIFGNSARRPSCHSFTFKLATLLPLSEKNKIK